jgi:hypothetical protein
MLSRFRFGDQLPLIGVCRRPSSGIGLASAQAASCFDDSDKTVSTDG